MNSQQNPDNSTAFIIMGFVLVAAIICRPQGSINAEFGKNPSLNIGENPKANIQR